MLLFYLCARIQDKHRMSSFCMVSTGKWLINQINRIRWDSVHLWNRQRFKILTEVWYYYTETLGFDPLDKTKLWEPQFQKVYSESRRRNYNLFWIWRNRNQFVSWKFNSANWYDYWDVGILSWTAMANIGFPEDLRIAHAFSIKLTQLS